VNSQIVATPSVRVPHALEKPLAYRGEAGFVSPLLGDEQWRTLRGRRPSQAPMPRGLACVRNCTPRAPPLFATVHHGTWAELPWGGKLTREH